MELVAGRVAKLTGSPGELVVDVRTDDPEERFAVGNLLRLRPSRGDGGQDVVVEAVRPHGGRLLVRLRGGGVRPQCGRRIARPSVRRRLRGTAPIEDPDEFYDHQLEGLTVRTVDGRVVGSITEVLHTAGAELLAVRGADGTEVLVPFVGAIVVSVSLADKIVEIDPPDGLLDLDGLE